MTGFNTTPKFILRLIHWPPQLLYALGLGEWIGKVILLLTTIGRKSGKAHVTPLQYEVIDAKLYVSAALGEKTDWVRNIMVDPHVEVRLKSKKFSGLAETISAPELIAEFLEVRYKLHPIMIGAILRAEGLSIPPGRQALMQYAQKLSLVVITPVDLKLS